MYIFSKLTSMAISIITVEMAAIMLALITDIVTDIVRANVNYSDSRSAMCL